MEQKFCQFWALTLLEGISENSPLETQCACLEKCANFHYQSSNISQYAEAYRGDLPGFVHFAEQEYQWIIKIDCEHCTIYIDENKDYCACHLADGTDVVIPQILCECSNFFIKKIFSVVMDQDVNAEVIQSYLRNGKTCIYKVTY